MSFHALAGIGIPLQENRLVEPLFLNIVETL
jgi:hypothetical protein